MEICELKQSDEKAWDEYVLEHPNSTFYHQIGWKNVVEKSYGHKPYYLLAKEDGEIKGVFPLFLMKSMLFGRKLVSVPFAPYGGICADDLEIESVLIEEAKRIVNNNGADYLEIRCFSNKKSEFITNNAYYTLILKLEDDEDIIWTKISRKVRNAIRKAINSNLVYVMDNYYENDFYNIYSKNMRDLGAPVHAHSFYRNLLLEFPEQTKIAVVKYKSDVIGGIFLLYFKDTIISGWASSDKSYRMLNPNNLLYWEVIKCGCKEKFKYFDFGRSISDSGTYRFKKPWTAEPKQLYYHYYLNNVDTMPDTNQNNQKRKIFSKYWRKLPLPLANLVGTKIRRNFP